jgi:hypothetical protein
MVLCDNVFCASETIEFEYVMLAGRRFCCIACAEDWHHQNEVLAEAASPFHAKGKGKNLNAAKLSASASSLGDWFEKAGR